ncbi:hypothetical protein [Sphingomonas sp.]|jgi:hypothetical protein|uniref:hypothetical protein n=1 Tax=Sphingomonas sp. TaxID=28214 RepID=UPI002DE7ED60|nr:hypothetical protein [Sphingomonas sp.]
MNGKGWAAASGQRHGQDGDGSQVERMAQILAAVLGCLREQFAHDYFRRCAFAARGIRTLLLQQGIPNRVVGGRFTALVVAKFGSRYALQGFQDGPELYPHLWIETDDRLIDLGPYLLPSGSPFPIVAMPPLIWNRAEQLPAALRYEAIDTVPDDAPFSVDPEVDRQGEVFAARCVESCEVRAAFPYWIATGDKALRDQADDPWVKGVRHFEQVVRKLPNMPH